MASAAAGPATPSALPSSMSEQVICSFKLDPTFDLPTPNSDQSIEAFRQFIGAVRRFRENELKYSVAHERAIADGKNPDDDPEVQLLQREHIDVIAPAIIKAEETLQPQLRQLHMKKIHFGTGNIDVQRALALMCGMHPRREPPKGTAKLQAGMIESLIYLQKKNDMYVKAIHRQFMDLLIPPPIPISAHGGGKRKVANKKLSKRTSMKGGTKRRGPKKSSKKGSKKASMKGGAKRRGSKKASKKASSKKGSKKASMKGGAKRRGSKKASKKGSKSRTRK
jgi:hypothetical protein